MSYEAPGMHGLGLWPTDGLECPAMKQRAIIIAAGLMGAPATAANYWQECQIETATLCGPEGCRNVEPTLKLYLGDYANSKGVRKGYYRRCRRTGECDLIENPWIGTNEAYRVYVLPEHGLISRVAATGKVTDVATLGDTVLISRGTCWSVKPPSVRKKGKRRR